MIGSKISSHFVWKMSSPFGTFADKLCEVFLTIPKGGNTMNPMYSKIETGWYQIGIKTNNRICAGKTIQKALFTTYQFYLEIKEKPE